MKDIRYLTDEERADLFRFLKPIGYKEGDDIHTCEILDNGSLRDIKGFWRGKPLQDYTKKELIKIILEMGKAEQAIRDTHKKELDFLASIRSR